MAMEIERKWVYDNAKVFALPRTELGIRQLDGLEWFDCKELQITYLYVSDGLEVRIRHDTHLSDNHEADRILTIKGGGGLSREELERSISKEDFDRLCRMAIARLTYLQMMSPRAEAVDPRTPILTPIVKRWYGYRLPNGRIFELSLVDGFWWYSEVEFDSEEEAKAFELPESVKALGAVDVTGDPHFQMKNYWKRTREV